MDDAKEFSLLTDEKFDFDISLSPTSAKEDNEECDDEVFIGPVKHREKCVRAAIAHYESEEKSPPQLSDKVAWSPLSGDTFVEIFKEAHLLALQIECFSNYEPKKEEPSKTATNKVVEKFVQESKSKLKIFETNLECNKTPIAIKRETYCVQDSPFHQLPPSVQKRLAVSNKDGVQQLVPDSPKQSSPARVQKTTRTLSVSPLAQKTKAMPLKNIPAASKPTVSKLQPLKASSMYAQKNHLTVEKPKSSKKPSPGRLKPLSSAGSCEDLLSDKSSIASDVSDTSLNCSVMGQKKRVLAAPNKPNLKKTEFKAPTSGAFRKNTSSSSSSQSNTSLNSSLVFSPPGGNVKSNSSLNTSINTSKLKSNPSRLALVRPTAGSTSSLKMNSADHQKQTTTKVKQVANGNKPSLVSVQPHTPSGKFLRQTSAPNLQRLPLQTKPESAMKGAPCTKPQARVLPTPTSRLKLPQRTGGLSPDRSLGKTMKPTRLLSCGEIGSGIAESTPLRDTQGSSSNLGKKGISATPSAKRVSALPTPLSRRTSGLLTPRTVPRSFSALRTAPAQQVSNNSAATPVVAGTIGCEGKHNSVPYSPCSPTEKDASTSAIPCSLSFSPENKPTCLIQCEMQKPVSFPAAEVLLIDIGTENHEDNKVRKQSLAEFDSQPLIDLSNTPELNKRIGTLNPANIGQLIDLSSPLIKLSPSINKENMDFDSPLLKF
ncbi:G2 and S phase-expressed protein 1 [Pelodytes ibericus]